MPNWCEGTLKVRGTFENVCKFFKEGIHCYDYHIVNEPTIDELAIRYYEDEIELDIQISEDAYIEETKRAFAKEQDMTIIRANDPDEDVIALVDIMQAWLIHPEDFQKLSEKYKVDFRIYAYESGMGFNQEIEIIDGRLTLYREIAFDDYSWECPNPKLGG